MNGPMRMKKEKKVGTAPKVLAIIAALTFLTIAGLELSCINSPKFKTQLERDKILPELLELNESQNLSNLREEYLRAKLSKFNVTYETDFMKTPHTTSFVSPTFQGVSTVGKNDDIPIGLPTWAWTLKGYYIAKDGQLVELKILQDIDAF